MLWWDSSPMILFLIMIIFPHRSKQRQIFVDSTGNKLKSWVNNILLRDSLMCAYETWPHRCKQSTSLRAVPVSLKIRLFHDPTRTTSSGSFMLISEAIIGTWNRQPQGGFVWLIPGVGKLIGQRAVPLKKFFIKWHLLLNCHRHRLKKGDPITMKFCTYQDSTAVLVCAKFRCDQI